MKADKLLFFICLFGAIFAILGYSYFSTCHYLGCYCEKVVEACSFKIDINFLVAIAAFYGVVLGFMAPLSKKEIRETRETVPEFLLEDFDKRTNIVFIVKHLAIGLLSVLFLILFHNQFEKNLVFNFFVVSTFIHFIVILKMVYEFTQQLHRYTHTENIFSMLEKEIADALKK